MRFAKTELQTRWHTTMEKARVLPENQDFDSSRFGGMGGEEYDTDRKQKTKQKQTKHNYKARKIHSLMIGLCKLIVQTDEQLFGESLWVKKSQVRRTVGHPRQPKSFTGQLKIKTLVSRDSSDLRYKFCICLWHVTLRLELMWKQPM